MGFFSSSQTQESEMKYDNPELRQYTAAYRGAAPWGFATLDPTATLAAMGKGTSLGGTELGTEFKDYLKNLSTDEQEEKKMTDAALTRIEQRQKSGQFLTPQETAFINQSLDQAFEYAHRTGVQDWTKATQMMAGGRGMRMSDTPVAEPALKELRNFEVGLGSKRAELGLAATMDMSRQQQEFDKSFVEFNKTLAQNRWSTRQGFLFGGGLSAAANLGYKTNTKTTTTAQMSGFQKVMAGFSMVNAGLDLGKKVGGMMMAGGAGGGSALAGPISSSQNGLV